MAELKFSIQLKDYASLHYALAVMLAKEEETSFLMREHPEQKEEIAKAITQARVMRGALHQYIIDCNEAFLKAGKNEKILPVYGHPTYMMPDTQNATK